MDQALELTPQLGQLFAHAFVLGGSPCSGKSTIAARLSQQFGLLYYKVDDYEQRHLDRCRPNAQPTMGRYARMGWDAIWMQPLATQVADVFAYYRERFQLILEDLAWYDPASTVILEGVAFLPELVQRCNVNPARVLYMVPTTEFQVDHYRQRPWIEGILQQCAAPAQAFANWMARDQRCGQEILRQAESIGYRTMVVDGTLSIDDTYTQVVTLLMPRSFGPPVAIHGDG